MGLTMISRIKSAMCVIIRQKNREHLHNYWMNPNDRFNSPELYLQGKDRSEFLVTMIKDLQVENSIPIMELGCNVGRNLNELFCSGFRNLSGIEINQNATGLMRKSYPELSKITIHNHSIENKIRDFKDSEFGIVFTMAVLMHIHKDSHWVFEEIARITGRYLVTIEDEKGKARKNFPRDYGKIFEKLGMVQVRCIVDDGTIFGKDYRLRVFKKPE